MSIHLDVEPAEEWRLYQFDTGLDCALSCGPGSHDLYDGLSNEPLRRVLEHAKTKGWWPHVTGWRQLPEVYTTEAEAREAERKLIRSRLPLANEVHNGDNPHRLVFPKTTAVRGRTRRQVTPSRPYAPATQTRSLSAAQQKCLAVAATWTGLSAAGWWEASRLGLTGWRAPLVGAVAALLLIALATVTAAEVKRRWNSRRARRQRRRLARRVTALTVAAGVVGLLYLTVPHLLAHLPAQAR